MMDNDERNTSPINQWLQPKPVDSVLSHCLKLDEMHLLITNRPDLPCRIFDLREAIFCHSQSGPPDDVSGNQQEIALERLLLGRGLHL